MISIWWVVAAFLTGGSCGIFVMVLLTFAKEVERVKVDPRGVGPMDAVSEQHWS